MAVGELETAPIMRCAFREGARMIYRTAEDFVVQDLRPDGWRTVFRGTASESLEAFRALERAE